MWLGEIANVLATDTESDDAAEQALDGCRPADESDDAQGWVALGKPGELAGLALLKCLRAAHRWFAPFLDLPEVGDGTGACAQGRDEVVGGGYGVSDGVVDPGGTGGRHGVGGVTDAEQAGFVPAAEPIGAYRQQLDLVPVGQSIQVTSEKGGGDRGPGAEGVQAIGPHPRKSAFGQAGLNLHRVGRCRKSTNP